MASSVPQSAICRLIVLSSDHAQLFIMSTLVWSLDPAGENLSPIAFFDPVQRVKLERYFPSFDKHDSMASLHYMAATNIYKTKDNRFFHTHGTKSSTFRGRISDKVLGSLDPRPTIELLGLPPHIPASSPEQAGGPFADAVSQLNAEELQDRTDKYRQAGTICYSVDDYNNSEHGKANAHVGLFEIHHHQNPKQKAAWWPETPQSSPKRPLAGLKVVDLTRVIAAPAASRGLAELGASVMRITSPNITDMSSMHIDLNHGKWNAHLDLKSEPDREKLRELIRDADVFLQGYRPYVLDKYGFGEQDILELCKDRPHGIIYVRENSYGWNGPWKCRSGWQQISDAVREDRFSCTWNPSFCPQC